MWGADMRHAQPRPQSGAVIEGGAAEARRLRAPGQRYVYLGHVGARAAARYRRQGLARVLKLHDDESILAHGRLAYHVRDVPTELGTFENLALAALRAADETRSTWAQAINALLDKFNETPSEESPGAPGAQIKPEEETSAEGQGAP